MITFQGKQGHTIARRGTAEDWLDTIEALLFLLGNQNPECPASHNDTYTVCSLISDMLPSVDQIIGFEQFMEKKE